MSTSFFDVLMIWLGSGPGSPKYCQMVTPNVERAIQFGEDTTDGPAELLQFTFTTIDSIVAAPTNALAWHVPDLTLPTVTEEEKKRILAAWPPLRRLNGTPFTPQVARGDELREAILLEVFPSAYRRLEYLFSSLEVPVSEDDWDIPRYATPRWFWIWGFGANDLVTRFNEIATEQWEGQPAPTIEQFVKGLAPVYVDAGEELGKFEDDDHIQVRAFDATGLPIDPDFAFATFKRLEVDSDFGRLKTDHPENPPQSYEAAARHVIVFCDQEGKPYSPRPVEPLPPTDPEDTVEPLRRLLLLSPGLGEFDFAEHGVLTFANNVELGGMSGPIGLGMVGTHVRFGSYPNGDLGKTITVDFAPKMFLRLQVLDYRDWFPRNTNPRNRLTRYTEGNLITPLVDGANFFKELYRILRATYKDIDPTSPAESFDPYAPVGNASSAGSSQAKVLLSNAWIDAYAPLLGLRGLIAAPKTQDASPNQLPSYEELNSRWKVIAAYSLPGLVDVPFVIDDQAQWWLVSDEGMLPPGACVEMRQLVFSDTFHGDDPRLAGISLNEDFFGIVAPFPGQGASSRGFASTTGRFVLPIVYKRGTDPFGTFRITLWPPNSSEPVARNYGEVRLPQPDNFMIRPELDAGVNATQMRLVFEGIPGQIILLLPPGTLTQDRAVIVVNPRSGEVVAEDHTAAENANEIRIVLINFAVQDRALVGFTAPMIHSASECPFFFELYLGRMPQMPEGTIDPEQGRADPALGSEIALSQGTAPADPTELGGLLREAIAAGVDVRLLGWKDPIRNERESLDTTLGLINSIKAVFDGRRGQAVWDAISRETFHVHHQKATFVRTASLDFIAFLGGIDLRAGRWDTSAHRQPDPERPSSTWHDVQCKVEGKAAWDVYRNIMQRWNVAIAVPEINEPDPVHTPLLPPDDPSWGPTSVVDDPTMTKADGPHAVQINRTLPPHLDVYGGLAPPFDLVDLVTGDLSVKTSWIELLKTAERFLYIEDQYFWIQDHARELHRWLKAKPERFLFLVMPRQFSDLEIGDQIHYALRRRCLNLLLYNLPDTAPGFDPTTWADNVEKQVAMFHLISDEDREPIYVHSKLVIADDTWFTIGSANLTRRSWTFDSEINAACVDVRMRSGGHVSARQLRVDLLAEHLQLRPVETALVEDPRDAFVVVQEVLADKRPWMRTHMMDVDMKFTHYGMTLDEFDPLLRDAVDRAVDNDGTQTLFDLRAILYGPKIFQALTDIGSEFPFGGLGRLSFNIDVSGLNRPPEEILVRVEIRENGTPENQEVTMGPWPATGPVNVGLVRIGTTYLIQPTAVEAATANVIVTMPEQNLNVTEFVTTFDLVFQ